MVKYTQEIKRKIYDCIFSKENPLGQYGEDKSSENLNVIDFLKLIWDLPAMPSKDPRFKNAEADAIQHMINNDDWTLEDALLKRFNLLSGEDKYFTKFIEAIVSPEVQNSREKIDMYVSSINQLLKTVGCELATVDFINGLPCYRLMEGLGHRTIPIDISPNSIPIFVDSVPDKYPAFKLTKYEWDDYGYKTRYKLFYYSEHGSYSYIGVVRILCRNTENTYNTLAGQILSLGEDYCSLGSEIYYYKRIKELLGVDYKNFLHAMRDAACFSQICDDFRESGGFQHSLLRETDAEIALNNAIYVLAGYDTNDPTSFVFKSDIPYYKDTLIPIKFDFGRLNNVCNLNRIIALIGNNGVGKTTVLSQIAQCIVKGQSDRFAPHIPIFTKVISVSYSIFDKFYNIEGASFNYTYCGIQKNDGVLMSQEEQISRRRDSLKVIEKHDRKRTLHEYLSMILSKELINEIIDDNYTFIEKNLSNIHLSSGQTMLMNLIIEIIAHIRQNTLILLDEPEIHLHPKGITVIVNIINRICENFASCCIMATHSSLIIQNLLSKNVIILDREPDGSPIVRPMRVESLGENLTTITEDVFGRGEFPPYYMRLADKIVKSHDDMDKILGAIQNKDVPLNMSLRILLEKKLSKND